MAYDGVTYFGCKKTVTRNINLSKSNTT